MHWILQELIASGPGRIGVGLFCTLVLVSLYVVVTYPSDFGSARWSNPAVWADHPKAAPPSWVNHLSDRKRPIHRVMDSTTPDKVTVAEGAVVRLYRFPFEYWAGEVPSFLSLSFGEVVFQEHPPNLIVSLLRPDGQETILHQQVVRGPPPGETPPYRRHSQTPQRTVLASRQEVEELFGVVGVTDAAKVLPGNYELRVRFVANHPEDALASVRVVVAGSVFGIAGTDALGRDLASALLFGLPVALMIGLAASISSTAIGATLGLISGYAGGRTDTAIQRMADIVANVPALPLLIFLVFILGSRLWVIFLVLVAFSWPGLTVTVRSMVLQLRSGQGIEAAQALGASRRRILFRHVFPQIAPFVFAQLIFFAPSAILAEAGLSFLGLGDPSIPTWGQILEHGFRTGAVFLGYWWWIVPPGLLIVLTAVTFMLLALGMEPVVNPRLRRMVQ